MPEVTYEVKIRVRVNPKPQNPLSKLVNLLSTDKEFQKHLCQLFEKWRMPTFQQMSPGVKIEENLFIIDGVSVDEVKS